MYFICRMFVKVYVLQATSKVLEERVNQLEQGLVDETKKREILEQESNRLFEAEEAIAKLQATLEEKDGELKLASESSGSQVNCLSMLLIITK